MTEAEEFEFRARAEQEADATPAASPDHPSSFAVAGNAIAKGVAALPDMFMNAPINAWNLSKAITGYTADKLGHPEILDSMEMTPTPDATRKVFSAIGLINPDNEPQTPGQRILDMAAQAGAGMLGNPMKAAGAVPKLIEAGKNLAMGVTAGTVGGVTKEATGSDSAAIAAGVVTPLVTRGAVRSNANAPTLANPVKSGTLRDAQAAGYIVPPSQVKPSFATNKLEGIAGKAAVRQESAIQNQQVTNRLAAEDIGLPGDTVLTESVLHQVREEASSVYREIAAISPRAASALEGLKQARFDAKEQWNYYARSGNPEAGKLARAASARAEQYERAIDSEAKRIINVYGVKAQPVETVQGTFVRPAELNGSAPSPQKGLPPGQPPVAQLETREVGFPAIDVAGNSSKSRAVGFPTPSTEFAPIPSREVGFAVPGAPRQAGPQPQGRMPQSSADIEMELLARRTAGRPGLLDELRAARVRLAKTYDIEKALNLGTGDVSAPIIGRLLDQGGVASKSGNLRIIGKFAQAYPSVTREGAVVPASGVSGTDAAASAMLGTLGYGAAGGPAGLIAGGLPLLRAPARAYVLSKGYQNRLLKEPPALNHALLQSILGGRAIADAP